jgi:hypothetical protein
LLILFSLINNFGFTHDGSFRLRNWLPPPQHPYLNSKSKLQQFVYLLSVFIASSTSG